MACEYVRQAYGVPAEIGRRVTAYGKPGVIAKDMGQYIGIVLDADEPDSVNPYHPTDGIVYLGMGAVRQPKKKTKSQRRAAAYQKYGDWFDSFIDCCRWFDSECAKGREPT